VISRGLLSLKNLRPIQQLAKDQKNMAILTIIIVILVFCYARTNILFFGNWPLIGYYGMVYLQKFTICWSNHSDIGINDAC